MKKTVKTVALLAVLGMAATGCQKDDSAAFTPGTNATEVGDTRTMMYSVDGVQYETHLRGEQDSRAFVHRMMDLAVQGHTVLFGDGGDASLAVTKDIVYFSTSSQAEAESWALKMVNGGYQVTVTYDENTKMFNCVAYK